MKFVHVQSEDGKRAGHSNPKIRCYEEYREIDERELKRSNEIWKYIIRG